MEISLNIRPTLIKERTKHTILSMLQIMATTLIIAIMHVLYVESLDVWLEIVVFENMGLWLKPVSLKSLLWLWLLRLIFSKAQEGGRLILGQPDMFVMIKIGSRPTPSWMRKRKLCLVILIPLKLWVLERCLLNLLMGEKSLSKMSFMFLTSERIYFLVFC